MKILIVLVLALSWPVSGLADWDAAVEAYKAGDYATALREWQPLAEQGNAGAQNNLAYMYHDGQGVPQDFTESLKWCRLAAEQGYPRAQTLLGVMYYRGQGVPQDYVQAYAWFNLATTQGEETAQNLRNATEVQLTASEYNESLELSRELFNRIYTNQIYPY